jgi:hypothetical protein
VLANPDLNTESLYHEVALVVAARHSSEVTHTVVTKSPACRLAAWQRLPRENTLLGDWEYRKSRKPGKIILT